MLPLSFLLGSITSQVFGISSKAVRALCSCVCCFLLCSLSGNAQTPTSQVSNLITTAKATYAQEAFPPLATALDICREQKCPDTLRGKIYHRLSIAYFQGYLDHQAIRYADSSILFFEQGYPPTHPALANAYYNRAVMQSTNQQLDQATIGFVNALQRIENSSLIDEARRDSIFSYWLQETAKTFRLKRDFYQAEKYATRGYAVAQKRWPTPQIIQGDLLRGLGNIRFDQQDFTSAITYFKNARSTYQKLQPRPEEDLLKVDENLGLAYANTGNFQRAERYMKRVLLYRKELVQHQPTKRRQQDLANTHINLLWVLAGLGKYQEANVQFKSAQALLNGLFPRETSMAHAELYYTRAYSLKQQGKPSEAWLAAQKTITILSLDETKGSELMTSGTVEYLIKSLALQAKIKVQEGQIEAAIDTYQAFNDLVNNYRKRVLSNWPKYYLIQEVLPIYEDAIELCLMQYEQTGAYHFLEQAYGFNSTNKAIVLRESLQQARVSYGLPQNMRDIRQDLEQLNVQLLQHPKGTTSRDSLQQAWLATQNEYLLLTQQLEEDFPPYYQFKYAEQKPIVVGELRAKLAPEQALIEYFCGANHWYAFVITQHRLHFYRLPVGSDINEQISIYHELLTTGVAEDCEKDFLNISYQLYEQVLAMPLETLVDENIRRLIFVPDGLLHYLAFESLVTRARSVIRGSADFLLEQYACSYLYSPYFLIHPIASQSIDPKRPFGGFGMEYDEITLSYLDTVLTKKNATPSQTSLPCTTYEQTRRFGKLFYSDDEVRTIADLLDGDLWLNEQVTKATFIDQVDDYQILHLALHGSYDLNYPMNSALAFSKTDDEDALLRAWEIYGLDLGCNLITLSACNTSYGKLMPGEGAMTLARAFNYAGVPSVIASLWSLPDRSASVIMPHFYELLKRGLPKDMALQQAKLAYLQDDNLSTPSTRLPGFWGPAIIIGDTAPIKLSSTRWKRPILLLVMAILSITLFLYFRPK